MQVKDILAKSAPLFALAAATAVPAYAQGVATTTLVPSGAMTQLMGYSPMHLVISPEKPAIIKKMPEGLIAPMYGVLTLGSKDKPESIAVIIDQPDGAAPRAFVDSNMDGDLTNDPAVIWTARPYKNRNPGHEGEMLTGYFGLATVPLPTADGKTEPAMLNLYQFDKNDAGRMARLKNVIIYYHDFARAGKITLGGRTYDAMLDNVDSSGDYSDNKRVKLMVDVASDGHFYGQGMMFMTDKPFNIGGTTYEIGKIAVDGSQFTIVKSDKTVAEFKPTPMLSPGKSAYAFTAKLMDGSSVNFPTTYKGHLVLLDFWATWCGPCKAELPKLTAAYSQFHSQGFEVLGVSLDQANAGDKLAAFTKANDMPWSQVYDGQFWKAQVAQLYHIQAIPAPILVDGDTGRVVAVGDDLRGDKLAVTLTKALARKKALPAPQAVSSR